MNKYEVVSGCNVPVGKGFRYKTSGQIVTLSDEHAAALAEHIKPVGSEGVADRNTEPEAVEQPVEQPVEYEEAFGEVTPYVGDSQAGYE